MARALNPSRRTVYSQLVAQGLPKRYGEPDFHRALSAVS